MAVIDLRGSNDQLFADLGSLIGSLATNPDDKVRKQLFENPEFKQQLVDEAHMFIQDTPGAKTFQDAINLRSAGAGKLGDARVRSDTAVPR